MNIVPVISSTHAANLLRLANLTNDAEVPLSAVSFGTPVAVTGSDNTQVVATPIFGQGYTIPVTLTYNRISIADYFANQTLTVDQTTLTGTTIHEQLPAISTALGLNLQATEIVDGAFDPTTASTLTITISTNSYVWLPGTVINIGVMADTGTLPDGTFLGLGTNLVLGLDTSTTLLGI